MNKNKLIFADGSEVEIESASGLSNLKILSDTKYDMVSLWDKFTEENLKIVTVKNVNDIVVGVFNDLVLVDETSTINDDGSILTSFNLRQKSDIEKRLDEHSEELSVHTDAIFGLGEAVSTLAEGQIDG